MNLELLKRFYVVVEEKGLIKASRKLNIVPAALTKSIQNFEYYLKTQLFDRKPQGMRLTPQGERLYIFAKQILSQTDTFERVFHEKEDEISGELTIMTTPHLGAEWLLPNLAGFFEKYPNLKTKIILRHHKNLIVEEADIAICAAIPRAPHLIQKHLFTCNICLFANEEYLQKFGTPKTVKDLDYHRLITYGGNIYNPFGNSSWVLNLGKELWEPSRESFIEVDSLHGLISSAKLGLGIIEAPDDTGVLSFGLVKVLPQERGPQFDEHFIFSKKRQNSKKINLLFKYLKDEILD